MRKFRFKFAAILKQRKIIEEAALRALGQAQREHQNALAEKADLLSTLSASLERREKLGSVPVEALHFRIEEDFITGTKQRIVRSEQAIFRSSRGVEKTLRAYLLARRRSRTIELLYERHFAEYKRDIRKAQLRVLDDLMIMRSRFPKISEMEAAE